MGTLLTFVLGQHAPIVRVDQFLTVFKRRMHYVTSHEALRGWPHHSRALERKRKFGMNSRQADQTTYDAELHMFREPTATPRPAALRFYRWLAERGQLEHSVYGPPVGDSAQRAQACTSYEQLIDSIFG